ncbi:MAG: diguanylate cyclase [Clostridia bacterium]|nr:diguanylate cyclase [Clostridia bacterium]
MKKKFELIKTIQLLCFMAVTIFGLWVIFNDHELYQMVGRNASIRTLCILLWVVLALCYVGIFWDFSTNSSFKKDYRELDYAVHNDLVAGIANRYSCDAMIAKYVDRPLPDNVGCIMLDLLNLREINDKYGHLKGNDTILEFSNILHTASLGLCFVGRNGGNKFMALFEDCDETALNTFLSRVNHAVEVYNAKDDVPRIEYRTGRAYSKDEHVKTINQLIGLSDRRLTPDTDRMTGFANRAGCDEIINQYLDKPMPEDIGCIMLDIANIREINDKSGRLEGNRAIRQFGDILREASVKRCFVGRNGGTKFLALFEACTEEKLNGFIDEVTERVEAYNRMDGIAPIRFVYGRAFHEGDKVTQINQLIALSDRRSRGEN